MVLPHTTGSSSSCSTWYSTAQHCLSLKEFEVQNIEKFFICIINKSISWIIPPTLKEGRGRYAWRDDPHSVREACCQPPESSYSSKWPDWVSDPPGGQGQSLKFVHQDRWLSVGEDNLINLLFIAYFMIFWVEGLILEKDQIAPCGRPIPLRTLLIRLMAPF